MLKAVRTAVVLCAVIAGPAHAQAPADPRFAKGMAQVQDGYLDDGVATLAEVGRRLALSADRGADLAQVYLWMGIAHAQLDAAPTAKFAFREALRLDGRASLAEGWPPKVGRLFATVKEDYPDQRPGHAADLEARLREAIRLNPKDAKACAAHVIFLYEYGRSPFEELVSGGERCAQVERALALKPESLDGLVYKGLFLRIKALVAADAPKRPAYLAEARRLEKQAMGMKARLPENAGTFIRLAVEPGVPGRVVE